MKIDEPVPMACALLRLGYERHAVEHALRRHFPQADIQAVVDEAEGLVADRNRKESDQLDAAARRAEQEG